MLNLDYKVGGRDSIFLFSTGLGNIFERAYKVDKKIRKKVSQAIGKATLPSNVYEKLSDWETKHRMDLKMLGAVVAIAVASVFIGPLAGQLVTNLGGPAIASMAAEKVVYDFVKDEVKKKLQHDQINDLKRKFERMTAEQVLADPELNEISQKIAAEMGGAIGFKESFIRNGESCRYVDVKFPFGKTIKVLKCDPISDSLIESGSILAAEGAAELERQISKIYQPSDQPLVLKKPINPIIPIGIATAAGFLLM